MKGYIVKGIGGFYYVKTEEGIVECKPRGIFRKQKIAPVAGDEVTVETENGASVIAEIDALVAAEQKISAIKVLREHSGLSLREAKD